MFYALFSLIILLVLLFREILTYKKNNKVIIAKGHFILRVKYIINIIIGYLIIYNFKYILNYRKPYILDFIYLINLLLIAVFITVLTLKDILYENLIYINGYRYNINDIKSFKWNDTIKTTKIFNKSIEYVILDLTIEHKYKIKIFDNHTKNISMKINCNDKEKVNSFLLKSGILKC